MRTCDADSESVWRVTVAGEHTPSAMIGYLEKSRMAEDFARESLNITDEDRREGIVDYAAVNPDKVPGSSEVL